MLEKFFGTVTSALLARVGVVALFAGFIFSLCCFTVIAFAFNLLAFSDGKIISHFQNSYQSFVFSGVFIAFTGAISGLLYLNFSHENDDVYAWVRRKLVGDWICTFETVLLTEAGSVEKGEVIRIASMGIDPMTKKLFLKFSQLESDLFTNRVFNLVGSGLDQRSNSYHLTIFGTYEQKVKKNVRSIAGRDEVVMPILYSLKFHIADAEQTIEEMEGTWYDLENVIVRSIMVNLRSNAEKNKFKKFIDDNRIANPGLLLTWKRKT